MGMYWVICDVGTVFLPYAYTYLFI